MKNIALIATIFILSACNNQPNIKRDPLENTNWVLNSIPNHNIPKNNKILSFFKNRYKAKGGCHTINGDYTINGS